MEMRATSQALAQVDVDIRKDEPSRIVGYGAVFYREGVDGTEYRMMQDWRERIVPGAFDRAIREDDVRGLFDHDSQKILGRTASNTMRLSVDSIGLRYEIELPDTTTGRDVRELIRRGDLSGSSFAFTVDDEERIQEGDSTIREIRAVKLYDVGPVTFPAYEATTTETVKRSINEWRESKKINPDVNRRRRLRLLEMQLTD